MRGGSGKGTPSPPALRDRHGSVNSLFREADRHRALTPLPGRAITHRASLYADDLVLLVAPQAADLDCVLQILQLFAGASGLVTNVDKCVTTLIRCSEHYCRQRVC